jgi:agmatinase
VSQGETSTSDFLGEGTNVPFERARAVVLPVPLEASVSYGGGTARGPQAILDASTQVETWDEELEREPLACGIHTDPPLPVFGLPLERALERVEARVGELLDAGKWVVTLGGEHSLTPPAVAAAARRHPGLEVVQLDAHADLRESYQGTPDSHACAMARCLEHAAGVRAAGIRSYSAEEAARIRDGIPGYRIVRADELTDEGWTERLLDGIDGKPVYLTVDVDYFDPSIVPATGTPEPGGGRWRPTLGLLAALFRRARVVAADVVELAPIAGLHHADFTVARLVHRLIGLGTY